MPTITLTARFVDALKSGAARIEYHDLDTRGLGLRITPDGVKTWCFHYRHHGIKRRLTLGRYPDLGLKDARIAATKAAGKVAAGEDPAQAKQAAKERWGDTVGALYDAYKPEGQKRRTWVEKSRILEREVLSVWKNRPVKDITRRDVRELLAKKAQTAPVMATRILSEISTLFNYGLAHDWLESNPATRIPKPSEETSRDRVLTRDEIKELWKALHEREAEDANGQPLVRLGDAMADAFLLLLLTGQRLGEVTRMRWAYLDADRAWWTIPLTKNDDPHRVPITAPAAAVLKRRREATPDDEPFVFTNRYKSNITDRAKKAAARLSKGLTFTFRAHDLRRTVASYMAEAGVPRHHIAQVLNHRSVTKNTITAVYDRYSYDKEKRAALETWAAVLAGIVGS